MLGTEILSREFSLIYSPDDGGYYIERHSDDKTSQVFKTREQALKALKNNKIKWSE